MQNEFSRPYDLSALEAETGLTLKAGPAETAALATRFGLEELSDFTATLAIKPWRGRKGVRLTGTVSAKIRQICVVSLDPFDSVVEAPFDELFAYGDPVSFAAEFDEADLPTELDGATLDIGEVVAEHFALALDPYPKKPGVSFEMPGGEPGEEKRESPFAALKALKGGDDAE